MSWQSSKLFFAFFSTYYLQNTIDGVRPDYRLISILYGNNKTDLTIDIIDPKKEGKLDILTKGINYGRDY